MKCEDVPIEGWRKHFIFVSLGEPGRARYLEQRSQIGHFFPYSEEATPVAQWHRFGAAAQVTGQTGRVTHCLLQV